MVIYVRGTGGGDKNYHWCRSCPKYPTLRISHATGKRPVLLLCPECERREREDTCDQ